MKFEGSLEFAKVLDEKDALRTFRDRFVIPGGEGDKKPLYFAGNSLGLTPKKSIDYVQSAMEDWAIHGVRGHFEGEYPWAPYHEFLTKSLSRVVGGLASEVVAMNTLTVNLHLMMVSFYRPTKERNKILIEGNAFPSDQYAVKSQIQFHGYDPETSCMELVPRKGEDLLRTEDILKIIDEHGDEIALVMLGGVNYYTGQFYDLEKITKAARAKECNVGFDLAHAVGNIPLSLHDWDVDFAVWCSYKYLNGGPGCVGGCFVHERHAKANLPRFAGWWGHDKDSRFKMGPNFQPISGAEGWQLSNPPILPLASLRASLEIFDEAGMDRIREKSKLLTAYLEFLLDAAGRGRFQLITPRDPHARGAQLSIRTMKDGKETHRRILASGVECDWREPDVIRVAPTALYNRFEDVHRLAEILTNT